MKIHNLKYLSFEHPTSIDHNDDVKWKNNGMDKPISDNGLVHQRASLWTVGDNDSILKYIIGVK